ncbi:MAG: hypothetical protein QOJ99_223 [Bryobacterales bacterium]|nr:hypothetical protein [Bryobacterales bacterium]
MSHALEYPVAVRPAASVGVVSRFLVHGLLVSTWVSRIPAMKESLHLSDGALGLVLLGIAIGSLLGIPTSGWLVGRFGSRRASTWTNAGFCLALVLPVLARDATQLFLALLLLGAMAGADDVAMNSQAVSLEKQLGTPVMSRFHAMFSLGGIVGAGIGALIAHVGIAAPVHLTAAAALILAFSLSTAPLLQEATTPAPSTTKARFRVRDLSVPLLALSVIGFCIFLSEGAIADWTAVYLKQILHADDGTASAGYAVFSAAMFIFRLAGDRITARLGRLWTIRGGALLAAAGLAIALIAPHPLWAFPGLAMAGAGYSSIIPVVFAAGGRVSPTNEGAGVAVVSGFGSLGFLAGPPAIGAVSQLSSLRAGLFLVVVLGLLASALVTVVARTTSRSFDTM